MLQEEIIREVQRCEEFISAIWTAIIMNLWMASLIYILLILIKSMINDALETCVIDLSGEETEPYFLA